MTNLDGYYNPRRPHGVAGRRALDRWYRSFSEWRSRFFENEFWVWPLPMAFLAVLWKLWRSRGTSFRAVYLLTVLGSIAGNASACAFIGHFEPRYAVPLHFVNYLLVAAVLFTMIGRSRTVRTA